MLAACACAPRLPDGGVPMFDTLETSRRAAAGYCSGRVLDSGIGFGYTLRGLIGNPRVSGITAAEIIPELCRDFGSDKVALDCRNVVDVMRENPAAFDCIVWDFGGTFTIDGVDAKDFRQDVDLFRVLVSALRPGGRLVTFDHPMMGGSFALSDAVTIREADGSESTFYVWTLGK